MTVLGDKTNTSNMPKSRPRPQLGVIIPDSNSLNAAPHKISSHNKLNRTSFFSTKFSPPRNSSRPFSSKLPATPVPVADAIDEDDNKENVDPLGVQLTEGDLGLCYSLSRADKNNYDTGEKIEEDSIQTFASKWTRDKTKSEELPELAMNNLNLDNGRGCNQNAVGASYENYANKIPDTIDKKPWAETSTHIAFNECLNGEQVEVSHSVGYRTPTIKLNRFSDVSDLTLSLEKSVVVSDRNETQVLFDPLSNAGDFHYRTPDSDDCKFMAEMVKILDEKSTSITSRQDEQDNYENEDVHYYVQESDEDSSFDAEIVNILDGKCGCITSFEGSDKEAYGDEGNYPTQLKDSPHERHRPENPLTFLGSLDVPSDEEFFPNILSDGNGFFPIMDGKNEALILTQYNTKKDKINSLNCNKDSIRRMEAVISDESSCSPPIKKCSTRATPKPGNYVAPIAIKKNQNPRCCSGHTI